MRHLPPLAFEHEVYNRILHFAIPGIHLSALFHNLFVTFHYRLVS